VSAYAGALETAGGRTPAAALRLLVAFLEEFGALSMSALVERVSNGSFQTGPSHSDGFTVDDVRPHLRALRDVLRAAKTNGAAADLDLLLRVVDRLWPESRRDDSLSSMLDALRRALKPDPPNEQVKAFIERLNKDMRSPEFEDTLAELGASKLKREHVVEIARAVYGGIPKSTSRKAALKFIRKPHDAYMSAKRGIEATGGRSAA
jgi:hypothetical protein